MHFSSRVDISAPNPIAAAEAAAKANGIALSKLNDSNPTRHGLAPELVPSVYTADPRGPRAAREALAAFLNTAKAVDASSPQSTSPAASEGGNERHAAFNNANTAIEGVDPDALYLLSSTSEAYSWLIKLLCDAGDAVLAPKPGYPLIESIARLECVDTVEYQLQFDGSWFIDIAELERLLSEPGGERIRALVLINPNNPTGYTDFNTESVNNFLRFLNSCKITLFLDEALIKADGRYTQRALTVLPRLGFQVIVSAPESKTGEILEVSTKAYVTYKDPDTGLTSLREAVLHQNDMDDESSSDILKDDGVAE